MPQRRHSLDYDGATRRSVTSFASIRPRRVSTARRGVRVTSPSRAGSSESAQLGTPSFVRSASSSRSIVRSSSPSRSRHVTRGAAFVDPGDVALERRDVRVSLPAEVAVCRATEAEVLAAPPTREVVPALVAGFRPVRDLVPAVPGRCEPVVDHLVAPRTDVVLGVARRVTEKRRASLDGERVHVLTCGGVGSSAKSASSVVCTSSSRSAGAP